MPQKAASTIKNILIRLFLSCFIYILPVFVIIFSITLPMCTQNFPKDMSENRFPQDVLLTLQDTKQGVQIGGLRFQPPAKP